MKVCLKIKWIKNLCLEEITLLVRENTEKGRNLLTVYEK